MKITSDIFEAYLNCPTKCFLRWRGETGAGIEYAGWVRRRTEHYHEDRIKEFKDIACRDGRIIAAVLTEDPKVNDHEWMFDFVAEAPELESHIHFIERTPPKESDKPPQFVPTRFVYTNKINKHDKLLLGFDALVLSEVIGREVGFGKIMHGDDHATLKVNTSAMAKEAQQLTRKISKLLSTDCPPELVLNRHCAKCEFQARCKEEAVELDDLSRLSGLTDMDRTHYRSRGIFTVTQLSHTFRPRKTSKRAKNPAKPHYFALQALAIRENTVYIHGSPRLPESETEIYLDIEGLPDDNFYYLVGALFVVHGEEIFQSFWGDSKTDELAIFTQSPTLYLG
jgi:predicted RecB family nuclease